MAHFAAAVASAGGTWRPVAVDVDDAADLEDLADTARSAAEEGGGDGGPVLVVLEREDEWFALVRADGEARLFVSDAPAAAAGRWADLLAGAEASEPEPPAADGAAAVVAAPTWAGEADLLGDLGVDGDELVATAEGRDTGTALAELAERCGFADALEAQR